MVCGGATVAAGVGTGAAGAVAAGTAARAFRRRWWRRCLVALAAVPAALAAGAPLLAALAGDRVAAGAGLAAAWGLADA